MGRRRLTYQISFSGGMGSAITALIAKENGLEFNLIFADTLIEDEDLYRFNNDIAAACKKEIVHLVDGRTPWDVYVDKRWIGNTRTAHCSSELKTKQVQGWLKGNAHPKDPLVLGMDWSEMDRIERASKNWAPRPVVSILNKYNISRADYDSILARYSIAKPRLYRYGWEHNNCGGWCCKSGLVQHERLYRVLPERYRWHEEQQLIASDKIGDTAKPYLRKMVAGKTKYLTMAEFREHIEAGATDEDMFSAAGCGCFTD